MSNEKRITQLDIIFEMLKYVENARRVTYMKLESRHFTHEELLKFHNDYELLYYHYSQIYRCLDSCYNGLTLISSKGGIFYDAKANEEKKR